MEQEKRSPKVKKLERIIYISFAVLVLFIGVIIFIVKIEDRKFLKEGIRVEASINSMYESGTTKNRNYSMSVSLFTKAAEEKNPVSDTSGKTESQKKFDEILDGLTINSNIGNYFSATINCNSDSYNKYKPGDRITVVYLKEDSTDIRILSELE